MSEVDPKNELTLDLIKQRAIKGIATLTGRTFALQIIAFVSTGLLTVFLSPEEYGIFFLVSAIINFFAYFFLSITSCKHQHDLREKNINRFPLHRN